MNRQTSEGTVVDASDHLEQLMYIYLIYQKDSGSIPMSRAFSNAPPTLASSMSSSFRKIEFRKTCDGICIFRVHAGIPGPYVDMYR